MIYETETNHKSAGKYAWAAAQAVRMNSIVNSSRFTDAQKRRAEQVKLGLEMVYNGEFFIEFRKTFISVKVNGPLVRDRKGLALLETCYNDEGFEKCKTKQGFTYRLFKEKCVA
jgi:hypothetical protein